MKERQRLNEMIHTNQRRLAAVYKIIKKANIEIETILRQMLLDQSESNGFEE